MNDRTEQTVTDVLPCPFCGSTKGFYVEEGSTFRWRVISCRNCGEGTEVRHKNNSDEPDSYIADWNAAAPYPAMLRKELDTLRAEKDRLTACLEKANISTEHFEREWYLRGDELDNLRAQLAEAQRDAERYRSLRRGQKWSVIDWTGDALRVDDLDAAIDAAKGRE